MNVSGSVLTGTIITICNSHVNKSLFFFLFAHAFFCKQDQNITVTEHLDFCVNVAVRLVRDQLLLVFTTGPGLFFCMCLFINCWFILRIQLYKHARKRGERKRKTHTGPVIHYFISFGTCQLGIRSKSPARHEAKEPIQPSDKLLPVSSHLTS